MNSADLRQRAERWQREDPDATTVAELGKLLKDGPEAELADRFCSALEFGTAGLRGVLGAGPNRMNRAVVRRTTLGFANYLKLHVPHVAKRGVVVARDGRHLSLDFAQDAAQVLAAAGIPALYFPGVVPTPVCSFAVKQLEAAGGVMVTASHNPPEYNGYKVYWTNSAQIIPPHDVGIAAAIAQVGPANTVPLMDWSEATREGLIRELDAKTEEVYLESILALRLNPVKSSDLNVVYTAMHGVGGRWVRTAMARAGFQRFSVVVEQQEPDGAFPTVRFPNPEEPGAMDLSRALAEKVGAELVIANDPDADRLALLSRDAAGTLKALSGNEVGVLLGHYLLTQSKVRVTKPLVMTTIVSSVQLKAIAEKRGVLFDETLTGFKWIANRALERLEEEEADFIFGYEEALGYTVGTVVRDKDGVGAALVAADMAAWCKRRGTTLFGYLEEIQREFGLFVSEQKSLTFPGSEGAATIAFIMAAFRQSPPESLGGKAVCAVRDYQDLAHSKLPPSNVLAYELEGGARVTLRPSGTEPKIKYYFELKETLGAGEPMAAAQARAQRSLKTLIADFSRLAQARGQPA